MKWLHENFMGLDRDGELLGFMNYFIVQCSFIYISFQNKKNNRELLNRIQKGKNRGLENIERHFEQGRVEGRLAVTPFSRIFAVLFLPPSVLTSLWPTNMTELYDRK
jgi:hypothetical protein